MAISLARTREALSDLLTAARDRATLALTATPTNDAGNLAIHPRTHKTVLALARRSEHRIRDLHYAKHDFGASPLQLRFEVGDVARARAGINLLRCVCDA